MPFQFTCPQCGRTRLVSLARRDSTKTCSPACKRAATAARHATGAPSPTLEARFWAKVNKNGPTPTHCPEIGPCWLWTGYCDPNGYGRILYAKGQKPERAHRVSWLLHFGPILDKKAVLHKCDNRGCVRPSHFFLGNHAINAQDMVAKGRNYQLRTPELVARGERTGHATLTEDDVRAIRHRWAAGGMRQVDIGALYGVTQSAIGAIVTRRTWRHVV